MRNETNDDKIIRTLMDTLHVVSLYLDAKKAQEQKADKVEEKLKEFRSLIKDARKAL